MWGFEVKDVVIWWTKVWGFDGHANFLRRFYQRPNKMENVLKGN